MSHPRPFLLPILLAATVFAEAAEPLRMEVRPSFTGVGALGNAMTVTFENDGPDARGRLTVQGEGEETAYPVELPRGARKRLFTVNASAYRSLEFLLSTNRGTLRQTVPSAGYPGGPGGTAIYLGDDNGALGFLRQRLTENKRVMEAHDLYVRPEESPGRAAAYGPYDAVVMGPGAERVADDVVTALKRYALSGGTVVFLGGASAATLDDRRWGDALPGRGWTPRTVAGSAELAKAGGEPTPGPFTVLQPRSLALGAVSKGGTFVTERPLGLGRIVVLGYSPIDAPLDVWGGRARVFSRFLRGADAIRGRGFVADYLTRGLQGPAGTYRGTSDPFSTRLPPVGTVFGILGMYFVLVVPVSFLVLKKLRRGELAWVTAPALSLGCAALLFKSAEGLYSATLSTASQGILILQEGDSEGMFHGTSQLFFPRGGAYDLGLKDVESLDAVDPSNSYGTDALAGFNPVDVGEIVVPRLEASNLAFREMGYSQRVEAPESFRIDPVGGDRYRVTNDSAWSFDGSLYAGTGQSEALRLKPGESRTVAAPQRTGGPDPHLPPTDARQFVQRSGRIALSGRIEGFRPGPQLGTEVKGQTGIDVLAFAQERIR